MRHLCSLGALSAASWRVSPWLRLLTLLAAGLVLAAQPFPAMAQADQEKKATTIGRPFSGDAGSSFSYELLVSEDRNLSGAIVNNADKPRRDVTVEITAVGLESRAPVWSVKLRLGEIAPGGRAEVRATYGRFTAEPGAFTFKFTEAAAPKVEAPPQPGAQPGEGGSADGGSSGGSGGDGGAQETKNACSSIVFGKNAYTIEGTGVCTSVGFPLEAGQTRFEIVRRGDKPIAVDLVDKENQLITTLTSNSTYYTNRAQATLTAEMRYKLKVVGEGKWTVKVSGSNVPTISVDGQEDKPAKPDAARSEPAQPGGKRFELKIE